MGIEQRKHRRHDLALTVRFRFGGQSHDVKSVNVSAGGMLVEMDDPPPEEESLTFVIELPEDDDTTELTLAGTVVHLGGVGFGIRFDRVSDYEAEMERLETYLAIHDD